MSVYVFFFMWRRPPYVTRTDSLCPTRLSSDVRDRRRERALAVSRRRLDQGEVDQVALGMAAAEAAGDAANGTEKPNGLAVIALAERPDGDRKSTRLNSRH